jgi:hypothetical protein
MKDAERLEFPEDPHPPLPTQVHLKTAIIIIIYLPPKFHEILVKRVASLDFSEGD